MLDRAPLLIELGVEELPAASVLPLAEHLGQSLRQALTDADFQPGELQVFATPRRMAALIQNVAGVQPEQDIQRRGPAVSAAFDNAGDPSKALTGFARSCGVAIEQLEHLTTDKGKWMVFNARQPGQSLTSLVNSVLPQLLKTMPMPQRMRWSDRSDEFLRPTLWLVALHGDEVLPVSVLSLDAGNITLGHRFHAPDPVVIDKADDYESILRKAYVIAGFDQRRELIREQVVAAAKSAGGRALIGADLLDEVCALVEWPVAIAGSFDEEFLELPKEALIQTMEENQRYFALTNQTGKLLPGFVTVANLESTNPETVRTGNERVIRPRLSDTMFFWNNDKRHKLADFRAGLGSVLFQEKLGSVLQKCERLETLAVLIAASAGADPDEVRTAARLCRCDLMSDIVNELPKMQGIAGRYYAARDGHPAAVAVAMEEQYFPKYAGGALPAVGVGIALAVAEKIDTLTGIFAIGMKPTGAKDPFGLRRAALGLLRVLIEKKLDLDVRDLVTKSVATYGDKLNEDFNPEELITYILERLRGYYQEQSQQPDVVEAVLAKGITHPLDFASRVNAIAGFRQTTAAASLAAAAKRIRNLLKKQAQSQLCGPLDDSLLTEPAEQALAQSITAIAAQIKPHYAAADYTSAMLATAGLREPVDTFFADVMVMVDDEAVRNNRLALLRQVGELCSGTADLSRLQVNTSA